MGGSALSEKNLGNWLTNKCCDPILERTVKLDILNYRSRTQIDLASNKEERTTRSAAGPATNSEPVSETQKGNNWKNIGWIILFFVGLYMVLYELALV